MNRRARIRKYAIHVLSVKALCPDVFDTPKDQNAAIICTDRTTKYKEFFDEDKVLRLVFPDVETTAVPDAFSKVHAGRIISFLEALPSDVTDLYICCAKGGSRSPGLAAAVLRMSGRSDRDIWRNPYYVPNTLVYYRMCKESGLPVTRLSVYLRKIANRAAYRKACRRGNTGKYERWQIIE